MFNEIIRLYSLVFIVLLSFVPGCAGTDVFSENRQAGEASNRLLRILFIGNSLTYFNELPEILEQLVSAEQSDAVLETDMIATGGATLESHWFGGEATKAIQSEAWDFVVLQEQSMLGSRFINGESLMNEPDLFHAFVRLFDQEIRKSGARTVLMLTWAHKDSPADQSLLNYAYTSIAEEIGAIVVPAGIAWHRVRLEAPDIEIFYDNVHPNAKGSYLAALAFGATLLPDRLVDDRFGDVSQAESEYFRKTVFEALEVLRKHDSNTTRIKPVFPKPSSLPETESAADFSAIKGRWRGPLELGPSFAADMELVVEGNGRAKLELTSEQGVAYVSPIELSLLPSSHFGFYQNFLELEFQFVLDNGTLKGVATRGTPYEDSSISAAWTLERN